MTPTKVPATVQTVHSGVKLSTDTRNQPSTMAMPTSERFPRNTGSAPTQSTATLAWRERSNRPYTRIDCGGQVQWR